MRKYALLILLALLLLPQKVFSNNNFIYSIEVSKEKNTPAYELTLKSDYKANIKSKTDGVNSIYFDIKNANLKEGFSTMYENANGVESVIAQQIGNKVRIYIKGKDASNTKISYKTVEKQTLPDTSLNYALMASIILLIGSYIYFEKNNKRKSRKKLVSKGPVNYKLNINSELIKKNTAKRHMATSDIVKGTGTIAQINKRNEIRAKFQNSSNGYSISNTKIAM